MLPVGAGSSPEQGLPAQPVMYTAVLPATSTVPLPEVPLRAPTGTGSAIEHDRFGNRFDAGGGDRTPFFGPLVMRVLVGCRSSSDGRTRRGFGSFRIGGVGSGCTRDASPRAGAVLRRGC